MPDFRYDVDHTVSYSELDNIRQLLSQMQQDDTCTIIIDSVNTLNADRVIRAIDEEQYTYFTKGISDNDTQIIVKKR